MNWQRAQKLYTLTTGKVMVRKSWNVIPMTKSVIARAKKLGADHSQLLSFFDQNQSEIGNEDATGPEDSLAEEEMPGVVGTNLQMNDNMEKVEVTNMKSQEWIQWKRKTTQK